MKDFLQSTFASLLGTLCALFVVFFVVSTYFVEELPPEIPSSAVLVIDETVIASEQGGFGSLRAFLGDGEMPSLPLRKIVQAIDSASEDGRIEAILLLNGSDYGGGAADRAVREALLRFRAAGKKVIAYAPDYSMRSYYLASLADPIYMPPLGIFEMGGYSAEMMFYASAMESIGVEMQVTRVGKYKSAVEPFLLPRASEANLEQMNMLLASIQDVWFEDVNAARGIEIEKLQALLTEGGLFPAQRAFEEGLVTKVAYFDQMIEDIIKLVGTDYENPDSFAQVGLFRYLEEMDLDEDGDSYRHHIAVIYAEGEIVDGFSDTEIGGDSLALQLREARLDSSVDAVVLRVNSPGGSATASEVILREMQLLREAEKPVVVSMGALAASGGYWISCQADTIVAEPNTITGSIGVFGMFPNIEKGMNELGVHVDTVQSGPFATLMSIYHHKSEEELSLMQGYVDTIYEGFLDRVSVGRSLTREQVHEIAQGRVWSGTSALELGLVDQLGHLEDAIAVAAEAIDVEYWYVDYREPEGTYLDELTAQALGNEDYPVAQIPGGKIFSVPESLQPLLQAVERNAAMLDKPGVYARLPYSLSIR
jgi:protease-4